MRNSFEANMASFLGDPILTKRKATIVKCLKQVIEGAKALH